MRGAFGYGPVGGVASGRRGLRGTTQAIVRQPKISADRVFCKLKLVFQESYTTGAAGAFAIVAKVYPNDMLDPTGAYSAIQATGFAGWCGSGGASYQSYIVHAAKVTVQAVQTQNNYGGMLIMAPRANSSAAPTTPSQMCGQARAKYLTLGAGSGVEKMSMYFRIGEIMGVNPQTVAIDDTFAALYNASPASLVAFEIAAYSGTGAVNVGDMTVTMDFWVEFFGRHTDV